MPASRAAPKPRLRRGERVAHDGADPVETAEVEHPRPRRSGAEGEARMDEQRFDELTRALASVASRRRVVGGIIGAAIGALGLRRHRAVAQNGCLEEDRACFDDFECCSFVCNKPRGRDRGKCTAGGGLCTTRDDFARDESCSEGRCVPDYTTTAQAPAAVWAAVTDAEALATWGVPNDFAPIAGHRFTLRGTPRGSFDGLLHGEVIEVETGRRVVVDLWGGPLKERSTVAISFDPEGEGTRLQLTKLAGPQPCTAAALTLGRGWQARLLKRELPRYLGQQRG